jgi:hypothetical protein
VMSEQTIVVSLNRNSLSLKVRTLHFMLEQGSLQMYDGQLNEVRGTERVKCLVFVKSREA